MSYVDGSGASSGGSGTGLSPVAVNGASHAAVNGELCQCNYTSTGAVAIQLPTGTVGVVDSGGAALSGSHPITVTAPAGYTFLSGGGSTFVIGLGATLPEFAADDCSATFVTNSTTMKVEVSAGLLVLGTMASQNAGAVAITGGSISGSVVALATAVSPGAVPATAGPNRINVQSGPTYTLAAGDSADCGTALNVFDGTALVTIPKNSSVTISVGQSFNVLRRAATVVLFRADRSAVTLNPTGRQTIKDQGGCVTVIKTATDAWSLIGSMKGGSIYGYSLGGTTGSDSLVTDCTTFATRVTAALASANLSVARNAAAGLSDGILYGYSLGGNVSGSVATTDCTTFATQATAALASANLSVARYGAFGVSDGTTYGYSLGGFTTGVVVTADCTTFATRVTAALSSANLSVARCYGAGLSDGSIYGYSLGGLTSIVVATADCTTFATQTTAVLSSANLSVARKGLSGLSDGILYGYSLGGNTGSQSAVTDCTTFATQATAALASANLSVARSFFAAMSDGNV